MPDEVSVIVTAIGIAVAVIGLFMLVQESRRPREPGSADQAESQSQLEFLGLKVPASPALSVLVIGVGMVLVGWIFREEEPEPTQITTNPDPTEEAPPTILFEAEDGALIEPFRSLSDETASGGGYIEFPVAPDDPDAPGDGVARYTLDIEVEGRYRLWARVRVPAEQPFDANSVFIRLEGDVGYDVWDFYEDASSAPTPGWEWELVSTRCDGSAEEHSCDPRLFAFDEGEQVLTIASRERNAAIDAFALTLDPEFLPTE